MTLTFIPARLRKPARDALIGAALATAFAVPGGRLAWWAIVVGVATAGRVIGVYVLGGEDSDDGALAGSRGDERVALVGLRSQALQAGAVKVAALLGLAVGIGLRAAWWWPFAAMLGVTGLAYLFGLGAYGSPGEDPGGEPAGVPATVTPRG